MPTPVCTYPQTTRRTEPMDMKKLCSDADTVLELLYNTYYEHVCTDDTD